MKNNAAKKEKKFNETVSIDETTYKLKKPGFGKQAKLYDAVGAYDPENIKAYEAAKKKLGGREPTDDELLELGVKQINDLDFSDYMGDVIHAYLVETPDGDTVTREWIDDDLPYKHGMAIFIKTQEMAKGSRPSEAEKNV